MKNSCIFVSQNDKDMNTVLGFNDEITTCECCGRVDLKGTYVIENESGLHYYGCVCAQKYLGGISKNQLKVKVMEVNKEMVSAYTEACYNAVNYSMPDVQKEIVYKQILSQFPALNQNRLYY